MNSLPPSSESWNKKNFLNGGNLNQNQNVRQWLRQSRIKAQKFYNYFSVEYIFLSLFNKFNTRVLFFRFLTKPMKRKGNFTNLNFESKKNCSNNTLNSESNSLDSFSNHFKSPSNDDPNSLDFNLFKAYGPGVYQIRCKMNGKRYFGESSNVLDHLSKHIKNLEKRLSDCSELQKDWDRYHINQFEARILYIGPEWSSYKIRLKKEMELIQSCLPEEVYNYHPKKQKTEENYRLICEINGVRYNSIGHASKMTGESQSKIRVKLKNQFQGYQIVEKVRHGYEPIIVNGTPYSSIMAAVDAGEAKDRFQAMRRLKSLKFPNWNYQSPEKFIKKE